MITIHGISEALIAYYTVYPRSSDPFNIVTYYIKWETSSWTYSINIYIFQLRCTILPLYFILLMLLFWNIQWKGNLPFSKWNWYVIWVHVIINIESWERRDIQNTNKPPILFLILIFLFPTCYKSVAGSSWAFSPPGLTMGFLSVGPPPRWWYFVFLSNCIIIKIAAVSIFRFVNKSVS